MTDAISSANNPTTPMSYRDRSRPLPMVYADQAWKSLAAAHNNEPGEAVLMMQELETLVKTVKSYDVDQLWEKIQDKFVKGRTIKTKATTDDVKALTTLSLFYNATNLVDQKSVSSNDLLILREVYEATVTYMQSKFRTNMNSKDKRNFDNIATTISERIDAVKERFNELVETGQMAGGMLA